MRYSRISIGLHWGSAFLVAIIFILGWCHYFLDENAWDRQIMMVHRQLGLLILLGIALRWGALILHKRRNPAEIRTSVTGRIASLFHAGLYFVLLMLIFLGWGMTNAQGHVVTFLQWFPLPSFIDIDPDWADTLQEWHFWAGCLLFIMIFVHASAALFHHFFLRDQTLIVMWPGLRKKIHQK